METETIFELNAMYGTVSHKLGGVVLNEKNNTWAGWMDRCSSLEDETQVNYCLRPGSKKLHIFLKVLPANPFLF